MTIITPENLKRIHARPDLATAQDVKDLIQTIAELKSAL